MFTYVYIKQPVNLTGCITLELTMHIQAYTPVGLEGFMPIANIYFFVSLFQFKKDNCSWAIVKARFAHQKKIKAEK